MAKRDVGGMGERHFGGWCDEVGIIANPVVRDRTGWDYQFEFPLAHAEGPIPLDRQPKPVRGHVQVKATDRHGIPISVKLDNWVRFTQESSPTFFLVILRRLLLRRRKPDESGLEPLHAPPLSGGGLMRLSCALAVLLLSGGGCLFSPGSAAPARALCTEGEAEAALGPLRPTQTASCNYDIAELNRRILSVLALSPAGLEVETIERTFGLPRLHTSFDDSWGASYSVIVSGKAGTVPWGVAIYFDETFFPRGGSHPARFKGTMRPVRIRRWDRGDIRLSIQWLHAPPIRPDSGVCLPNDWLVRGARRAGWHRETVIEDIADIGPRQRIALEKGRAAIWLPFPDDEPCLGLLELNVKSRSRDG